jgi:hypothetical protein
MELSQKAVKLKEPEAGSLSDSMSTGRVLMACYRTSLRRHFFQTPVSAG